MSYTAEFTLERNPVGLPHSFTVPPIQEKLGLMPIPPAQVISGLTLPFMPFVFDLAIKHNIPHPSGYPSSEAAIDLANTVPNFWKVFISTDYPKTFDFNDTTQFVWELVIIVKYSGVEHGRYIWRGLHYA